MGLAAVLLGSVLALAEAAVAPDQALASSHSLALKLSGDKPFPTVINEGQTLNISVENPCQSDSVQIVTRLSTAESADLVWSDTTPNRTEAGCGAVTGTFQAAGDTDGDDERFIVWLFITGRGRVSPIYEVVIRDDEAKPAQPTNVVATPGNAKVTLTWDRPVHPPVTGWELNSGTGSWESITPTWGGKATDPLTHVITGLTNGMKYSHWVRASNGNGTGPHSGPVTGAEATPTRSAVAPAAPPASLRAVGLDGAVQLSWTQPGEPVTHYAWRARGGSWVNWTNWTNTTSTHPSIRIGGLSNGTEYSFQVNAHNGTTVGPHSEIATATPNTAPTAVPGNLAREGSNAGVSLTWTAAARATGYLYRYRAGTGNYGDWKDAGSGTSFHVEGLTNATTYSLQMRAVNGAGRGPITDEISTLPLSARVTAVRNLRVAGNGPTVVRLAWDAPERGTVSRYGVRRRKVGDTGWGNWLQSLSRTFDSSGTGLTLGNTFDFEVRAYGPKLTDYGPRSTIRVTVGGSPSQPNAGHAVWNAAGTGATATWTRGSDGATAAGWEVRVRPRTPQGSKSNPFSTFGNWTDWSDAGHNWLPRATITGLDSANTYEIQAHGDNGVNDIHGPERLIAVILGKPRYLEATANDRLGVTLTWAQPPIPFAGTFTRWEYRYRPINRNWTAWTPTTNSTTFGTRTQVISNLIHNQQYNFQVRAINGQIAGFPAQVNATAKVTKPAAPTGLRSVGGDGQVALHWGYSNSAAPVSVFQYRHRIGTAAWSGWTDFIGSNKDSRDGVVTGLTNDTTYSFEVRGQSGAGNGTAASTTGTPRATQAKVYWGVTGKIRRANLDGTNPEDVAIITDWVPAIAVDAAGGKIYWSEIHRGNGRDLIVRANLDGTKPEILLNTRVGGSIQGGAIYGLAVDPDGGKLYWTESGATDRVRRSNLDGSGIETVHDTGTGNASSPNGLALDNAAGKAYWVDQAGAHRINVGNMDGTGSVTRRVNLNAYDAQDLALDVGAGKIYWSADGDAGNPNGAIGRADLSNGANVGNVVTGLQIGTDGMTLDAAGGKVYWTNWLGDKVHRANTSGTITVSDVQTGEDAAFDVALLLKPAKPQDVAVAARGGRAILTWKASAISDGGSAKTYEYRYKAGTAAWTEWADAGRAVHNNNHAGITNGKYFKEITSLTNGTAHQFQMRAKNFLGIGPTTASVSATPTAPPAKPTGLSAVAGNGWINFTWNDPGDSSITKWEFCEKTGTATCNENLDSDWKGASSRKLGSTLVWHNVRRPVNITYKFRFRAVNAGGPGPSAGVNARPRGKPPAPTGLAAEALSGAVKLTWDNPNNSDIDHYEYQQKTGTANYSGWNEMTGTNSGSTSYTVTGLNSATEYKFKIRAVTSTFGPASNEVTVRPAPGAVTTLNGHAGDNRVRFVWSGPNPVSGITGYKIRYNFGSAWTSDWVDVGQQIIHRDSGTLAGLHGKTGWFEIKAVRGTVEGAVTRATAVEGPPGSPRNLTATPGVNKIDLAWTVATVTAGTSGTVTGFEYCQYSTHVRCAWSADDHWTPVPNSIGTTSSYSVPISDDTRYNFRVRSRNLSGASNPASNIASATRRLPPAKPAGLTAVPGETRVKLTWTASSDTTIQKYQVCQKDTTATCSATTVDDWTDIADSDKDTASHIVTGLDAAKAYRFRIRAVNDIGNGTMSDRVQLSTQKLWWSSSPHPVTEGDTTSIHVWLEGGNALSDITVTVADAGTGTAESDDYTFSTNKTLTIAQGNWESAGVVTIATHSDADTDDERINYTGTVSGGGGFLSAPTDGALAILDSARPKLKLHLSSTSVVEGSTVTVRLQAAGTSPLTASAATNCTPVMTVTNFTAESGDVTASSTTFTWPTTTVPLTNPYATNTITLTAVEDTDKDHESVGISVAPGCSSSVADGDVPHPSSPQVVLKVLDNDAPRVAISLSANPIAEGSSATITATMAGPATTAETVLDLSLIRGSAAAGDFSLSSNSSLTIAAGATTSTGTVTLTANQDADTLDEGVYVATLVRNTTDNPTAPVNLKVFVDDDDRVPLAPVGLTATRGDGEVTLAWTGPRNSTITKYQYCKMESASDACNDTGDWADFTGSTAATRSGKATGLTNGTTYYFKIRAVNAAGAGAVSAEVSATPQPPVPAKPTGLTATGKHQSVALSWTAPNPANTTITKYQYCQKTGAATCDADTSGDWTDMTSSGASTTSYTVGSLTNGTTYKFRIRAVNPGGNSPMSDSASASPRAVPAAPTGLTAQPASGQVTLNWTDPSNSTITGYEYRYRSSGGSWPANWTTVSSSSATTTTTGAIGGLTDGTTYNFEVRAVNSAGDGTAATVDATPNPVPSAPTGLSAVGKHQSVELSWTTPANTSGTTNNTTITKFQYQKRLASANTWTGVDWADIPSTTGADTSGTVSGLVNGTAYTFRIRAVNPSGDSAASGTSNATPAPVPAAPTGLTADAGDGQVTLSWANPSNSTITKYQYCQKTSTAACGTGDWEDFAGGSSATTTSKVISSLSNSTQYYFRIRAVNPSGSGAESARVTATPLPANAPAKPTGLSAAARSGQVILTWSDPSDSTITSWEYQSSTSSAFISASWTAVSGSTATTTTATVSSLTNGTTYYFRVRAVNATGNSDPSDSVSKAPLALPAAPTGLFANPGNARVTLSWTNPSNASIHTYQYCRKASSGTAAACASGNGQWADVPGGSSATTTSRTITGLANGTTYYFRIRAVNESGNGAASSEVSTKAGLPSKPVGFTVTGKNTSVTLMWTNPSDSTISEWEFQRSSSTTFGSTWTDIGSSSATTTSHDISGLTNGDTYYFRIRAVNSRGNGPASDAMSAVPSAKPSAPTSLTATGRHQSVALSWTAPTGSITDYDVCTKSSSTATCSGSDWVSTGSTTASHTVGSLSNGTTYYFRVRGVNNAGDGVASVAVSAAPTAVTVTPTTLTIAENSTTGSTYTVVLNSAPSANVTITPSSSASGTVTFSPSSLSFTSSNWSTAQTVTVVPVDNFVGNLPDRSTTLSHTASGGGYNSETVPSVAVTLTDNDIIVSNLTDEEATYTGGCHSSNCAVATAFTTGSNATGYTLTSAILHVVFTSSGGNTAAVTEVAVYADGSSGCGSGITSCPGSRVGSALSGPSSLTRATHDHTNVTWTSSAGIKLSASTKYWLVFNAARPAHIGVTNSTSQTSTDAWDIGAQVYSRSGSTWSGLFNSGWPHLYALGAVKLPAAPADLTATAGNGQVKLTWTASSDSTIVKYQICRKTGSTATCSETSAGDWADISGSDSSTSKHIVKGLTNGTTYKFAIRAVVAAPGPATSLVSAAPAAAVPAKPTGLSATAGAGSVDLAWTDPEDSSITEYEYCQKSGSAGTCGSGDWTAMTGSGPTTVSYTVSSLSDGTTYYFRIRAVNATGNSTMSDSANATPLSAPAAPTGLSADGVGKYGEVTLSWTDPSNTSISKYQYQQTETDGTWSSTWTAMTGSGATTTTYDVGGLTNGTTYYFRIRAVNASGNGAASSSASAKPGLPAQPSGLSATAGDGEVTITWTNPSDSNITGYQINQKTGTADYAGWTNISPSSATTVSHVVSSLSNGTVYKFKILAVSASGSSAESAEVTATPLAKPAAPSGFTATAGNTKVALAWTDPSNTSITRYEYRQKTGTAAYGSWTPITGSGATTVSHEVTGLTNGTQYKFRLRAVNASGNGAATAERTATPPGLPAKPTGLSATAKHESVDLAWTNPSNSAIDKYQYQYKQTSASSWPSSWTDMASSSATTVSFTVPSLTNGTAYDFRIRAVTGGTGGGPGPTSESKSATPAPTPAAPTGLAAVPAAGQVTLNWTGPSDTTIDKYQYQYKLNSAANWPGSWTDVSSSSSSTRTTGAIGGLTNGSLYNFRVRGVNPSGDGAASAIVNATPNPVPSAPSSFAATAKHQSVELSWTIPSDTSNTTNNTTITKFQYQQRLASASNWSGVDWADIPSTTGTSTSGTIGSLTNGTAYTFRIRAVNPSGNSAATGTQNATPLPVPAAPTELSATAGNGSVDLSWTAPSGTVTDYDVCTKTSSTSACSGTDWVSTGSTSTTKTVSSLTNGTTYYFRVRAVNSAGDGAASAQASAAPVGPPAAPSNFTATAGNTRVTLAWDNPNNSTITSYDVCQKEASTATCSSGDWTAIANSGVSTVQHVVTGLTNATTYSFRVRAVNSSGDGAASASASAVPQIAAPSAIAGLLALPYGDSITLTWTDPQDSSITKYQVRRNTSNDFTSVNFADIAESGASTTSYSVSGLTAGETYYFQLKAVNNGGDSPVASVAATPGTAFPPSGLTATPGDTKVTLTWDFMYLYPAITKYQLCQKTGTATCDPDTSGDWTDFTGTNTTLSRVVTGLTNDTTYKFQIRAVTTVGGSSEMSPPSNVATGTPSAGAVPVAPVGLSITGKDASVTLTWSNPSDPSITKYQYCHTTGTSAGTSCTSWSDFSPAAGTAATSGTVTGLTNNTQYWFRIRAVNAGGPGDATGALTATPLAAPVLQTPAVADRSARLVWSVSAGATRYQYCAKTDATACGELDWLNTPEDEPETPTDNPATMRATVRGLRNDTTYTIKLRAINEDAWTLVESNSVTVMPATRPRRPTGLTATAGTTQVTLSWTAPPVGLYGSAATSYEYCAKSDTDNTPCAGTDWKTAGTGLTKVVTGLTNGTTYTFRVRGKNGAGAGNPSNPVTAQPTA